MNNFWENRYKSGGDSGPGSYGESAKYKASIINNYINKLNIKTISDLGCGDGNQIGLLSGFELYHGYDVSDFIVNKNISLFKNRNNMFFYKNITDLPVSDLTISLDVLYHIVNMSDYIIYMKELFNKSKKYVLIYATNREGEHDNNNYCYHRVFTDWVEKNVLNFELVEKLDNPIAVGVNFYLYKKIE